MFGTDNKINFGELQKNDPVDLNNIQVETMGNDLKNPNGPKESQPMPPLKAIEDFNQDVAPNQLTEKQKSSPFLSEKESFAPDTNPTPIQPSQKLETSFAEKKTGIKELADNDEPVNWKRHIMIGVGTFLVLLALAGGYYFVVVTKNNATEEPKTAEDLPEKTIPINQKPAETALIPDKPNYLVIKTGLVSQEDLFSAIKEQANKAGKIPNSLPFEFVVSDSSYNPIDFQEFSNNLKLVLSPEIISEIKGTFSLFIYQGSGSSEKIGLAIDIKDESTTKNTLKKDEPGLISALTPLFLGEKYEILNNSFSIGQYKNNEIHYQNLKSLNPLSIDYTVYKGKLLIGTSKETMRGILDYIEKNSVSVQ